MPFGVDRLERFARELYAAVGMDADKATTVARLQVLTDAMGRRTHGLAIEALSQGLSGHGRKEAPERWGGNTFVQVIDPRLFAGADAFADQMDHFSERCRSNRPIDSARPVRVPGDQAARCIAEAQTEGIDYDAATWQSLQTWARELKVVLPAH